MWNSPLTKCNVDRELNCEDPYTFSNNPHIYKFPLWYGGVLGKIMDL